MLQVMAENHPGPLVRLKVGTSAEGDVSADKTSVVSADKTSAARPPLCAECGGDVLGDVC